MPTPNADFALTPELLGFLRHQEGWRSRPYLDQVGLPTIGYGHRIPSLQHPPITLDEGERLFREDVRKARDAAVRLSPILSTASERRCAAITDFCFNVGPAKYATSMLRTAVNGGEWAEAGRQNRRWVYGNVQGTMVKLSALVKRREMTAQWLETG